MTEPVDIFSKKSIKELQEEREQAKEDLVEGFKAHAEVILETFLELSESGKMSSLLVLAATEKSLCIPQLVYRDVDSLHKLTFLLDQAKAEVELEIAKRYGFVEEDWFEE